MNLLRFLTNNNDNKNILTKYLEECFDDILAGENPEKVFNSIRKTLNNLTKDSCIQIFMGKEDSKQIYGMSVYLDNDTLYRLARDIRNVNKNTKDITKDIINNMHLGYYIEIDPNIFNPIYKFTSAELTAILLHEIGHVTGDTDFYNELKDAYNRALFKMNNDDMLKLKTGDSELQYVALYILAAIQETHISKYQGTLKSEQLADKFVTELGYGNELVSAISKFNKIYRKNLVKTPIEDILDGEAKVYLHLMANFYTRRKYVQGLLDAEAKQNYSEHVSKLLNKMSKAISKLSPLKQAKLDMTVKILDESFMDMFRRNPLKISRNDIDQLTIETEMMSDFDDKSVIVYKINKRISQLTTCRNKLDPDSRDYKTNCQYIDGYLKELNNLLVKSMKFKPVDKTYGVFIKYPKGYEG